jgi:hypothetical protein
MQSHVVLQNCLLQHDHSMMRVAGGGFVASLFAPPVIAAFVLSCVDTKLVQVFSAKEVQLLQPMSSLSLPRSLC